MDKNIENQLFIIKEVKKDVEINKRFTLCRLKE